MQIILRMLAIIEILLPVIESMDLDAIQRIKNNSHDKVMHNLLPYIHPKDQKDPEAQVYLQSHNYYEWYYAIAKYVQPEVVLEIGVRFGYSAMAMLLGTDNAIYVGYDNESGEEDSNKYALTYLGVFTKAAVYVNPTDTQSFSELPYPQVDRAQLIHIDAHHTPEGMIHDLELVLPKWDDRGLILIDDVFTDRALYGAAATWLRLKDSTLKYKLEHTYRGMMIVYREGNHQE